MKVKKTLLPMLFLLILAGCSSYNEKGCLQNDDDFDSLLVDGFLDKGLSAEQAEENALFYVSVFNVRRVCVKEETISQIVNYTIKKNEASN